MSEDKWWQGGETDVNTVSWTQKSRDQTSKRLVVQNFCLQRCSKMSRFKLMVPQWTLMNIVVWWSKKRLEMLRRDEITTQALSAPVSNIVCYFSWPHQWHARNVTSHHVLSTGFPASSRLLLLVMIFFRILLSSGQSTNHLTLWVLATWIP